MNENEVNQGQYGVDQMEALDNRSSVRRRPGMYIGSTSQTGISHLNAEIVDNSIDEFMAGYGNEIDVTILEDSTNKITDYGRGIPVGPHKKWKNEDGTPMDTLIGTLTTLHAGGKFKEGGYQCFIEGSLVNTNNGLQKIEEIESEMIIINSYNENDEVIDKFSYNYDGEINIIQLMNGKSIQAIDNHYILIQRNKQLYWEKIENIIETDLLIELEENDDIEELKRIIPQYNIKKY